MITSPIGKKYIGQTVRSVHERWKQHGSEGHTTGTYLKNAFKKYGKHNMKFEVILECDNSELDQNESKYIKDFNTLAPHGYNLSTGGNVQKQLSSIAKENIRQGLFKRYNIPPELRNRSISRTKSGHYQLCSNRPYVYLGRYDTREEAEVAFLKYKSDPDGFQVPLKSNNNPDRFIYKTTTEGKYRVAFNNIKFGTHSIEDARNVKQIVLSKMKEGLDIRDVKSMYDSNQLGVRSQRRGRAAGLPPELWGRTITVMPSGNFQLKYKTNLILGTYKTRDEAEAAFVIYKADPERFINEREKNREILGTVREIHTGKFMVRFNKVRFGTAHPTKEVAEQVLHRVRSLHEDGMDLESIKALYDSKRLMPSSAQ